MCRYKVADYWGTEPLVLASLLVQEDLILLRSDGEGSYVYAAACACFSFTNIGLDGERGNMKMGNTLREVSSGSPAPHARVVSTPLSAHGPPRFFLVCRRCVVLCSAVCLAARMKKPTPPKKKTKKHQPKKHQTLALGGNPTK
jgi:hypothetical protein